LPPAAAGRYLCRVNRADDQPKAKTQADARAARLAAALKTNLRRRKAQARERAGADAAAPSHAESPPAVKASEE
jgi:hypothetical protein